MGRAGPLVLFACLLSLAVAPVARADEVIATVNSDFLGSLSAYGGSLTWTRGLEGSKAVFVWDGRSVRKLSGLAGRQVIHGADIGPGSREGAALAFARCDDEGEGTGACSVYRVGLDGGRPRPVRGASSKRYDERAPSIWKNRVVFVRAPYEAYTGVYPVPQPLRGLFETSQPARLATLPPCCTNGVLESEISATELRGRLVAYLATQVTKQNLAYATDTTVVVKRFDRGGHGRSCVVAHARSSNGGAQLFQPRLNGRYVYWLRIFFPGDTTPVRWAIHRRLLPTRNCARPSAEQWKTLVTNPDAHYPLFAVDQGRIYYAITEPGFPSRITISETPASGFRNR